MRFVDVKNDVAFRKIFGNQKKTKILISFLNAILKLEGVHQIKEITIKNPYQLPRVAGEKSTIIDVSAVDKQGRQFVIEMQVPSAEGFDKRVQYYTCRDYSMQINSGDDYALLKPTFFIGILDFDFFEGPHYMAHHIIVNGETYEHKLKDIQFTFVELKKFHLTINELTTLTEKWIFFIKNAKNLDVIPENIDDDGLIEAYKDAEKHSWNKEDLRRYDNAAIAEQDRRGVIIKAEKESKLEGKQQGKLEEKTSVVERCWQMKMEIKDIAHISDLSIEEVKTIIEKLNQ